MMRNRILVTCMLVAALCAPAPSMAAKGYVEMKESELTALSGKSLAVIAHASAAFQPTQEEFNAFKRFFAGERFSKQYRASFARAYGIDDPAPMLGEQLSKLLVDAASMQAVEGRDVGTGQFKPDSIAAQNAHADYVLSILSLNWYYINDFSQDETYPLAYVVQMQLIDTRSRKPVAAQVCGASTISNVMRPTQGQWLANGAQLTKDTLKSLAWDCFQQFSRRWLKIPSRKIPAIPPTTAASPPLATDAEQVALP